MAETVTYMKIMEMRHDTLHRENLEKAHSIILTIQIILLLEAVVEADMVVEHQIILQELAAQAEYILRILILTELLIHQKDSLVNDFWTVAVI